jgi:hypothetical protein
MFDEELAAIPSDPPRTGVLPGMRLGSAVPRSTLLVLLMFAVFFAFFPLAIMSSDPKMKLSLGPSQTTQGRVVALSQVSGCRGSGARRVVYTFASRSGSEFRGAAIVCEDSPYYSAQDGDRIEIRYLTRDPTLNAIAGTDSGNEPPLALFAIFPLFFVLALSPLYLPQLREVLRARRLYRSGVLASGKVVFVKRRNFGTWPGWPGTTSADVYVAYQRSSGGRAEAIVSCANDWLLNQLSPGAAVHILVPADRSGRGVLLEAFIR